MDRRNFLKKAGIAIAGVFVPFKVFGNKSKGITKKTGVFCKTIILTKQQKKAICKAYGITDNGSEFEYKAIWCYGEKSKERFAVSMNKGKSMPTRKEISDFANHPANEGNKYVTAMYDKENNRLGLIASDEFFEVRTI
jgi:hypothetical protein